MKKQSATYAIMMAMLLGILVTGCTTGMAHKGAKLYEPDFLTPELKKQNMLGNASFEDANSQAWAFGSWQADPNAGKIVKIEGHDGEVSNCVAFETDQPNVMWFKQVVRVKPKTKYLLSGWAKIDNITRREAGMTGAILCIDAYDCSPAVMLGTKDWTYLSCVVDSGDRTVFDVKVQVGNWSSAASGKAWFDDICLIELPALESTRK